MSTASLTIRINRKQYMLPQSITYDEAYQELDTIAGEIETESVSVDVLAEKVKRAAN